MIKQQEAFLVCPQCLGELTKLYITPQEEETPRIPSSFVFICRADSLVFLIKENIPVLLLEEAQPISQKEQSILNKMD
jgi:uncharacterized protein YbaR (Trm112 family)